MDLERIEAQSIEEKLGDGSWCGVTQIGVRSVVVSRHVESDTGRALVWGQAFDTGQIEEEEWPGPRVTEVVQSMRDMPSAFDRRTLWDHEGRAMKR